MTCTSPVWVQNGMVIYLRIPGTIVTEYKYDSCGKLLSTTGSGASTIGVLNPIRYRGYFYDTDLGFYLLETRYYDPETGRFINADEVVDNYSASSTNTYGYCYNDPVNHVDENGRGPAGFVAGLVVGGIANTLEAYTNGKRGWSLVGAFAIGAAGNGFLGLVGLGLGKIPKYTKTIKTLGTALAGAGVSYSNSKRSNSGTTKKRTNNTVGTGTKQSKKQKGSSSSNKRTNDQGVKKVTGNYRVSGFSDEAHENLRAAISGALGAAFSSGAETYTSSIIKGIDPDVWATIAEFGIAIYYETIGSAFEAVSEHSLAELYPGEQNEQ